MTQVMGTEQKIKREPLEGRKKCELNFFRPPRGLTMFGYELPKARAVGDVLVSLPGFSNTCRSDRAPRCFSRSAYRWRRPRGVGPRVLNPHEGVGGLRRSGVCPP